MNFFKSKRKDAASNRKPSIILIDDDVLFGRLMSAAAAKRGLELRYCSSVSDMYREKDWKGDVVIADYDLGRVTGLQLATYMETYFKHLPVLIVSAYRQIESGQWPSSVKGFVQKQKGPNTILDEAILKWQEAGV